MPESETTVEQAGPEPPGAETAPGTYPPSRRDHTGRDMILSLAVLLVPILIVGALLRALGSSDPTVVDSSAAIENARAADLFPVVVPQGLDAGWRTVQAGFSRSDDGTAGTLRLGYLSPTDGEALLVISNEPAGPLLDRELGDEVRPQGEVSIAGRGWTASLVRGGEHALVLADTGRTIEGGASVGGMTTIVVGRAPLDELSALAASLR